ncbi:hypothetical protein RHSIM_Rhsim02G0147400 [Rhododendron simsii]|uniref:Retroviral polymerase SH3-like domain-containing protein n=1 Tax=Rhododendron simsii TaxID=118357 RepID=A0A834HBJ4_RHOSS|nr:hypothetical protein RHSIM_Rhsim02G0147400 [Rhododendron simsii]
MIDREHLGKFDSRSDEGIFLGYCTVSRAFRVYNNPTRSVMESINVVVDESPLNEAYFISNDVYETLSDQDTSDAVEENSSDEDTNISKEEECKDDEQDCENLMKTRKQLRDEMIGSLLYLTASRPDIAFSVGVWARYQANPKESHLTAVKCVIKYISETMGYGICLSKDTNSNLVGFSDAD